MTDNKACVGTLQSLNSIDANSVKGRRYLNWLDEVGPYLHGATIKHIEGTSNILADTLSRVTSRLTKIPVKDLTYETSCFFAHETEGDVLEDHGETTSDYSDDEEGFGELRPLQVQEELADDLSSINDTATRASRADSDGGISVTSNINASIVQKLRQNQINWEEEQYLGQGITGIYMMCMADKPKTDRFVIKNGLFYYRAPLGNLCLAVPPNGDMRKELGSSIIGKCSFRDALCYLYHDVLGHGGVESTLSSMREKFSFPIMRKTIKSYINKCESCIVNKVRPNQIGPDAIGEVVELPKEPLSVLHLDHCFLRAASGEQVIVLVTVEARTGFVRYIHVNSVSSADTINADITGSGYDKR